MPNDTALYEDNHRFAISSYPLPTVFTNHLWWAIVVARFRSLQKSETKVRSAWLDDSLFGTWTVYRKGRISSTGNSEETHAW